MKTFQVSYHLHAPGQDFAGLKTCIQFSSVKYSPILASTWLIQTPISLKALHKRLSVWLDEKDEVFIAEVEKSIFVGKRFQWLIGQYVRPTSQLLQSGNFLTRGLLNRF